MERGRVAASWLGWILGAVGMGGQGSSAWRGSPAQLCGEQRGGDAAEVGQEVQFNGGSPQIQDAVQKCWESCQKKPQNLK